MSDLVVWTDPPDRHGQTFGTAGRIQMFIVGPDPESGQFVLGTRELFGEGTDMFEFAPAEYATAQDAYAAAEDELVRILARLDNTAYQLRHV